MFLNDLTLIEARTVRTNFIQNQEVKGSGQVTISYGSLNFEAGGVLTDDASRSVIAVMATPSVSGQSDHLIGDAFVLQMDLKMVYTYPSTETVTEDFLAENTWYFVSYLKTYFKMYAEQVLSQTGINGVTLPLN